MESWGGGGEGREKGEEKKEEKRKNMWDPHIPKLHISNYLHLDRPAQGQILTGVYQHR